MRINLWGMRVALAAVAMMLNASAAVSEPDARQIADSLAAATAATGRVQASYDNATANGDIITINDWKITQSSARRIEIPEIVITGAIERDGGGFMAQSMAFDGGTVIRGNDVATWNTGLIEEVVVPSADEVAAENDILPFTRFSINGISLSESNLTKPVTASEARVVMQAEPDGSPGAFAAQLSGVQFSAELLKGRPQEKAILDALGYEKFDVNIAVAGAFDATSQSMTINTLTINTAEIGTVTVKARFSGISLGKIISTRTDAETRTETKLDSLEVRFDNVGIVERALDMHAALIWGTREDAAAQINAALPLVLHFIGNDPFQDKLGAAFREFLVEPKSIVFSAAPIAPVSLEELFQTARHQLDQLPDLLQANVTAN